LFSSVNLKEFSIEQRERVLNILIRFGAVAKFRCRSNTAYDNFVNACFHNIANTERVKFESGSDFTILQAKLDIFTEYNEYLEKNFLEDCRENYGKYWEWVKGGRQMPKIEIIREVN
jgi:hypothetical protein